MGLAVHVLGHRVLHRLVVWQALVRGSLIGVDLCAVRNLAPYKALQRPLVGCIDHAGDYLACCPILRTHYGGLATRTPTQVGLLAYVLVLFQPADVGLIHFHRPFERGLLRFPRLA